MMIMIAVVIRSIFIWREFTKVANALSADSIKKKQFKNLKFFFHKKCLAKYHVSEAQSAGGKMSHAPRPLMKKP